MNIAELTVLILEDDDFQRKILADVLTSLGIKSTFSACNGRQALDVLDRAGAKTVDVALCDLNMPEMDGMEFLRHLGEEHRSIAVILISALDGKLLSSVGRMTQMYGIHLLGVIEKPVLAADIKQHLLKLRDGAAGAEQPAARSFSLDEILQGVRADQFVPFFQPKVDMKTGRIVGAEALARWLHPDHGVVGPGAFIPLLEQSGNIDDLTFRILGKSAAALRCFHEKGRLLTMSVNLSLVSLDDTGLAERITRIVREAGVEPHYLVLEITESAAMTNVGPALENLARLCMNGFALSIDDYGTGSSNLQQLTRIAFSELKIDQSFVKDFADNEALRIVVQSSIDMAHKLMVKSVAEGVETQEDWDALEAAGCDTVQGYLVAQPMDLAAFRDFVASYKREQPIPAHGAPGTAPKSSGINVLVVEDDSFTRKITVQVLRDIGYTSIVDVKDGASAIGVLGMQGFDLVITDVSMPGMNRLELVQRIRTGKTPAKPDARIVVLTSFSKSEVLASALALDINGFLVKPIIPAVVEAKLAQAMSERMHLHSPLAYEAVKTKPKSLPPDKPDAGRGSSIIRGDYTARGGSGRINGHPLGLRRLRPGMRLAENISLKDGTLILSSGQALTELSINRLIDLEELLERHEISVREG